MGMAAVIFYAELNNTISRDKLLRTMWRVRNAGDAVATLYVLTPRTLSHHPKEMKANIHFFETQSPSTR